MKSAFSAFALFALASFVVAPASASDNVKIKIRPYAAVTSGIYGSDHTGDAINRKVTRSFCYVTAKPAIEADTSVTPPVVAMDPVSEAVVATAADGTCATTGARTDPEPEAITGTGFPATSGGVEYFYVPLNVDPVDAELLGLTPPEEARLTAPLVATAEGIDGDEENSEANRTYRSSSVKSDGEVGIYGSVALDNGVQIISLVTWNLDQDLEEYSLVFRGDFGELRLGGAETAAQQMHYTALPFTPGGTTTFIDSPDYYFLPRSSASPVNGGTSYIEVGEDDNMVTYLSPRLEGFKVGVSYVPSLDDSGQENQSTPQTSDEDGLRDLLSVSGNYRTNYQGTINLAFSAAYLTGDGVGLYSNPEAYSGGGQLHIGRFVLGVSYYEAENLEPSSLADPNDDYVDIDGIDSNFSYESVTAGVAYLSGPWTAGIAWRQSEKNYSWKRSAGASAGTSSSETNTNTAFQAGATYDIGGGLTAGVDLQFIKDEQDRNTVAPEVEAFAGGFVLSFNF